MKKETVKKMVYMLIAFLGWAGVVVISFEIGYMTHWFVTYDAFSIVPLYILVLYYGVVFGAVLMMMALAVASQCWSQDPERKQIQEQIWKKGVEVE